MAWGGQCVNYVNNYFDTNIPGNGGQFYNNSSTTQINSIQSGCIACWSGGATGYGHVGVVESWNGSTMDYSDSNYNLDEEIIERSGITEAQMKGLFGSSFTFQGYVIPN